MASVHEVAFLNEPEARVDAKTLLQSLAASCPSSLAAYRGLSDGSQQSHLWEDDAESFISTFEQDVSNACGKERAVFFTSAAAANIAALTVNARDRFKVIALHKSSILDVSSGEALSSTLGFSKVYTGSPDALPTYKDIVSAAKSNWKLPGVISLEIPMQSLGGQCIPWEQVVDIRGFCQDRGIRLHLDSTGPQEALAYYGFASVAQLLELFDSAVIDFSRGLGCALGGALLLGDAEFAATARAVAVATATAPSPAQAFPLALACDAAWRARAESGVLAGYAGALRALLTDVTIALASAPTATAAARTLRFHPRTPHSNKVLIVIRASLPQCLAARDAAARAAPDGARLFSAAAAVSRPADYEPALLQSQRRQLRYPTAPLPAADTPVSAATTAVPEPETAFLFELGPANAGLSARVLADALLAFLTALPAAREALPFAPAGAVAAAGPAAGRPGSAHPRAAAAAAAATGAGVGAGAGAERPGSAIRRGPGSAAGAAAGPSAGHDVWSSASGAVGVARPLTLQRLTTARSSAALVSAASAAARDALEASRERARAGTAGDRAAGGFTGFTAAGAYDDEWPAGGAGGVAAVGADGVELGTEVVPIPMEPLPPSDDDEGTASGTGREDPEVPPVSAAAPAVAAAGAVPRVGGVRPAPPAEGAAARPGGRTFKFGLGGAK